MGVVLGRVRVGVLFTLIHGGRRSRRETLRIGRVTLVMKVVAWGRRIGLHLVLRPHVASPPTLGLGDTPTQGTLGLVL